jgi:uncharacterized protein (TIGR03435 family)
MTIKILNWRTSFGRGILIATATGTLVAGPAIALAQAVNSAAPAPLPGADGKPLAFDVVSIREYNPVSTAQTPVRNGPTSDGYHLRRLPLLAVIQIAYVPSEGGMTFRPNQITSLPELASNPILYDIDAKVSEEDLPAWEDPNLQPAMLRAMLQAMLADRFKLVVHRETKLVPIYELTVGGKGPRFKPSEATTLAEIWKKDPNAITLSSGTIMATGPDPGHQTLFNVTMQDLGTFLSTMAGRPIQDKTGLKGKYDITYEIELPSPPQEGATTVMPPDFFSSQIYNIVRDQLGLQLREAKGPVEFLVIDHAERPSEN